MTCKHDITTAVDEDGCCASCGVDLNYLATISSLTDELLKAKGEIGTIKFRCAELQTVLSNLMPFVLEDYYPDCATPAFKEAVENAKALCDED